jgi:pimeloyl-ACP methyl ester carboxylesterase
MLEVIDKGSESEAHPAPLLFVHGAWHGAWCWDEHFLDYFADQGYRALAVSLRGHGKSPAVRRMHFCRVADLVADVDAVAGALSSRPVVIGHSLGGFVVQKYLETHDAPAAVLIASAPPRGARGFMAREMKRRPWSSLRTTVTTKSLHAFDTPERAREYFFSASTAEPDVSRYAARLQEEFTGGITVDTVLVNLPKPHRITAPMLVLGAECDGCFTHEEVHATARAYGTQAQLFPEMGHNMMLEPGWSAVAKRIDDWLSARAL